MFPELIRVEERWLAPGELYVVWAIRKFDHFASHANTFVDERAATEYEHEAYKALWQVLVTFGFKEGT